MGLTEYQARRRFDKTPEPEGKGAPAPHAGLNFVVQKHAASHLHYDFRLELDGVLKSWAVPKGPSLNPRDRRLALQVEDHPLDYRTFEGVIPEGNYGAGTVMVWDAGTYATAPDGSRAESERALREGLTTGHVRLFLNGQKLRGAFSLVRLKHRQTDSRDNRWLLIKHPDDAARNEDIRRQNTSTLSGRTLGEIHAQESPSVHGPTTHGNDGLQAWDRDFEQASPPGKHPAPGGRSGRKA